MYRYFKKNGNTDHISSWEFKGLSDKGINPPTASYNSLAPELNCTVHKIRKKIDGSCRK